MADHFALMTGQLLTEETLRSAIHDAAVAVPSTTAAGYDQPDPSSDVHLDMGKVKTGVMVECRICQEEGDEAYMETPCSCQGSLKKSAVWHGCCLFMRRSRKISYAKRDLYMYAHHVCVQRWCNEKGDTNCEICLQQFTPNFTAPLKLFRHGRNPSNSRGGTGERPENRSTSYARTADQTDGASSFDSQNSNSKGVIYCRLAAIALMALLVLHDAVSLILSGTQMCSMEIITLLMFRTAGIVIPVYIILITATALLHSCNHQQLYRIQPLHTTPVSEPGGAGYLPATAPQQHQHIINIQ